ncbi:MAG: tRNA (adenosine(37)-N6)-threonylcarbamoyltransferase complex dimerization subunit type 1 TsaB [Gammaproteobacteria bacterium]|nr:MAG: tRNA (adenosine(37)-N6)-threonylcarbamoyltransferase complex dimerization subunit type 1 TsaB [Gammaproteobacteria bacterium]
MKLLALETATEACSVALWLDGELLVRHEVAPRRHAALLLPMAQELLAEGEIPLAALDAVAFGRGPGGFTGLRIAAGAAQGIAIAGALPVVPVSTLAALAQGCHRRTGAATVLAALDARMGEVYWGLFRLQEGLMAAVGPESVSPPEEVTFPGPEAEAGCGSGWARYREELAGALQSLPALLEPEALPHAADLARLAVAAFAAGTALPPERAQPCYLRDRVTG